MRLHHIILLLALGLLPLRPAAADMLVLVHGYAASAASWEFSGINATLAMNGWRPAGLPGQATTEATRKLYHVEVPAHAPLLVQTDILRGFLAQLRQQHPQEKLILAGHSAGGVVSRLAVLGGNPFNVATLITIAAPHLGTQRAIQGLDVVDSKPFFCPGPGIRFMKDMFGGDEYDYLRDSRGTLIDLLPQGAGSLLGWANQQPHPDIEYHAVIKQLGGLAGDELVPAYSQDMNQIPTLRGRVKVWLSPSSHSLNPGDGAILNRILDGA